MCLSFHERNGSCRLISDVLLDTASEPWKNFQHQNKYFPAGSFYLCCCRSETSTRSRKQGLTERKSSHSQIFRPHHRQFGISSLTMKIQKSIGVDEDVYFFQPATKRPATKRPDDEMSGDETSGDETSRNRRITCGVDVSCGLCGVDLDGPCLRLFPLLCVRSAVCKAMERKRTVTSGKV